MVHYSKVQSIMARRHPIALALPHPLPPLPTEPVPSPSPLQRQINTTLSSTDYDAVCVPLTNELWQDRWERLCLRFDEEGDAEEVAAAREKSDRDADQWRKEGGFKREELVVSRLEETPALVAVASDWLEMDSPDEGIRFDSELVSKCRLVCLYYISANPSLT